LINVTGGGFHGSWGRLLMRASQTGKRKIPEKTYWPFY
jgi:hypothetical protein